jgi:hypothetical protein
MAIRSERKIPTGIGDKSAYEITSVSIMLVDAGTDD